MDDAISRVGGILNGKSVLTKDLLDVDIFTEYVRSLKLFLCSYGSNDSCELRFKFFCTIYATVLCN
jgi:hypothetical protein